MCIRDRCMHTKLSQLEPYQPSTPSESTPPPASTHKEAKHCTEHRWSSLLGVLAVGGIVTFCLFFVMGGSSSSGGSSAPASVRGTEELMSNKAHGTCDHGPEPGLRWGCDLKTADRICCFNRHYAEYSGYWQSTAFLSTEANSGQITFYDTISRKPLFIAPRGRSFEDFVAESQGHGWPSFRDQELVTENVRVLPNGETVSVDGTHLGHNLPDSKGNRYCINLVSVAGQAPSSPPGNKSA
eukprot:TRINITY_DN28159_c0_g1_i2.p1 TRINITY_DN28159_c0_g1~~TRINITY_DN28159_c0_g1_i2.p1  ORF type:complete len:240 (-),score=48.31 TRINITY_DN28159_c0_g1_i2:287-1006(-)